MRRPPPAEPDYLPLESVVAVAAAASQRAASSGPMVAARRPRRGLKILLVAAGVVLAAVTVGRLGRSGPLAANTTEHTFATTIASAASTSVVPPAPSTTAVGGATTARASIAQLTTAIASPLVHDADFQVWLLARGGEDILSGLYRIEPASAMVTLYAGTTDANNHQLISVQSGGLLQVDWRSQRLEFLTVGGDLRPTGSRASLVYPTADRDVTWAIDDFRGRLTARRWDNRAVAVTATLKLPDATTVVAAETDTLVVTSRLTGGTFAVRADGSVQRISPNQVVAYSPGGSVEVSCDEALRCIESFRPPGGSAATPLWASDGTDRVTRLSPDGRLVATVSNADNLLVVRSASGGELVQLGLLHPFEGPFSRPFQWSPDGKWLVFLGEQGVVAWSADPSHDLVILLAARDAYGQLIVG